MSTPQTNVPEKTHDKYKRELAILMDAGVGVVMTRTREIQRTLRAIKELAFIRNEDFRQWDCATGWSSYSPSSTEDKPIDTEPQYMVPAPPGTPMLALKRIRGVAEMGPGTKPVIGWSKGVMVMSYMHPWLDMKTAPGLVTLLKSYAYQFAETSLRLVLLMPDSYSLPAELEDDITVLDMDPPTQEELTAAYSQMMDNRVMENKPVPKFTASEVGMVIASGSGLTVTQFEDATSRAIQTLGPKKSWTSSSFSGLVLNVKSEALAKSDVLRVGRTVSRKEIGGLEELLQWTEDRRDPFHNPDAQNYGCDVPKGCMVIGPPGTGKSLAAGVVADILEVPLIDFEASGVFDKFVGGSEGKMKSTLALLKAMSPCVAFIDEIDKMFDKDAGSGDSGVGKRVMGQLLKFMQANRLPIFMLFAANRAKGLPSELVRRGRLNEIWSVSTPNSRERKIILEIHSRKRNQPVEKIDFSAAVARSQGYVGAELEQAVSDAVLEAYLTKLPHVTGALIEKHIMNIKPISKSFAEDFEEMETWATSNSRRAGLGEIDETQSSVIVTPGQPPAPRIRRRVSV